MSTYDLPIDLVYLYVNNSDEEWIAKRSQYAMDQSNSICRFRDNKELVYSLRSVEEYAPWIRNIYIVSNSSMPDWLNTDHPKIHVIDQESIMPSSIQPCFNSNVIESHLYKIPGLSEIFLYACDDMFLGNHVSPDFFVKDAKPIVRMKKKEIAPTKHYFKAVLNSRNAIFSHYGKEYALIPWHNIDVYSKTGMEACAEEFRKEFEACSHHHLRVDNDLHRIIFHYYLLANNLCILKTYDSASDRSSDLHNDYFYCSIHALVNNPSKFKALQKKPVCACVNDSENTTESDAIQYPLFMSELFPEKSSFEKYNALSLNEKAAEAEKQRADKLKSDLDSKQKQIDRLQRSLDRKKKQVDTLQYDLDCVHDSVSFRVGRTITWAPRKVRGGVWCFRDHGAGYTLRRALYHMGLWKDEEKE